MDTDKKTIGLTAQNKQVVENLINDGWFSEQKDAAKFAMSLAIKYGMSPDEIDGLETVWNVGSFDDDGELKKLIPIVYPNVTTPYRAIEYLINIGLDKIGEELNNPAFDLASLVD